MREVAAHNTAADCWVVIFGVAYDLSEFYKSHPGGGAIITNNAGKDVSALFEPFHPKDLASRALSPTSIKGPVDPATITEDDVAHFPKADDSAASSEVTLDTLPPLHTMLNSFDFEAVARRTMSKQGWYYYSSGADDEITLRENRAAFQRVWLKPRVLVNVTNVDTSSTILGHPTRFPLYITATALGKLAHEDGELALIRACASRGIVQMMPTLSSYSLEEMLDVKHSGQILFSQLYVNPERQRSLDYIRQLEAADVKALFITVDAPQLGRREKDMRQKFSLAGAHGQKDDEEGGTVKRDQGVANALSSFIDSSLCWKDLAWFAANTRLPIVLKGIQCGEDAVLALQHGCRGIVLSNHGGRQLDMSRSSLEVLPEVMQALRGCSAYSKGSFDVVVDGGIRRGADIFKAVALGATAVGIGRPSLYALAAYGQPGVERVLDIMHEELEKCMRLMGTPTINDISERCVITRNLGDHVGTAPADKLMEAVYEPLWTAVPAKL